MKTETEQRWTLAKWYNHTDALMDNGVISSITNEEICEKLNQANALLRERDALKEANKELVEALKPFETFANEVIKNGNLDKDQTVYAYNKATIMMQDLRTVLSALKKYNP